MSVELVNLCRFCGVNTERTLKIKLRNDFVKKIHRILRIKIDLDNDELPKQICKECCSRTQNTFAFIQTIRDAEENLLIKQEEIFEAESPLEKLTKLKTLRIRSTTRSSTRKPPKPRAQTGSSVPPCKDANLYKKLQTISKNITIQKISPPPRPKRKKAKLDNDEIPIKQEVYSSDDGGNDPFDNDSNSSDDEPLRKPAAKSTKPASANKDAAKKKPKVQIITMEASAVYLCMTCKEKFPTFEILKDHMKTSEKCTVSNLTCDTCGKISKTKKAYYQHNLVHRHKVEIVCELCGKMYSNRFNLENHKSLAHGETIEEEGIVYKCQICEKQFTNRKILYEHIGTHSNDPISLLCEACGKSFTSQDSLKAHIRSHLNIRNFKCEYCDKRFRSRVGVLQHSHIHTGEKAFKCSHCHREFAKKESLLIHERQHTGDLPYVCVYSDYCRSSFASLNQLKNHLKKVHPHENAPSTSRAPPHREKEAGIVRPFESNENAELASFMTNRMSMLMAGSIMPGQPMDLNKY